MSKNPSYTAAIASYIVDLINESKLAKAERVYTPEVKLAEVSTTDPQVYVRSSVLEVPRREVTHSRGHRFIDIPYDLLLIKKVDGYDIRDVDEVIALYEEIDQYIWEEGRSIPTDYGASGQWVGSSIDTTFSPDALRNSQVVQMSGQIVYRHQT